VVQLSCTTYLPMSLLIYSYPDDPHAAAVAWAYQMHYGACEILNYAGFPAYLGVSVAISDQRSLSVSSFDARDGKTLDHSAFGTVWNRRSVAVGLVPNLPEEDAVLAQAISRKFLDQIRACGLDGQTWVNSRHSQVKITDKLYQLTLARDVGFIIPNTIISNDPAVVRQFVRDEADVIVKSIWPMIWPDSSGGKSLATTPIKVADLDTDEEILACPMIYQKRVRKLFELRIVVFGREVIACKLHSQNADSTKNDFRVGDPRELQPEIIEISRSLERRILEFMKRADLLHASFDVAVTEEGDAIFFEVNEQGQTLWLEDCNPRIRMLDRLISFFHKPCRTFRWDGVQRVSFPEWQPST
jgi:glutathione synthase/RimK-type ligase-like ATP-grasp enzyme